MKNSEIFVTGGAGYKGSVLIPQLLKRGYTVTCLDRFFFGNEFLSNLESNQNLKLIRDDIRWFNPKFLKDIDVVIDLAALSNDPVGELDPTKTFDINFLGRSRVARLSKKAGVKHYILASSASNYGFQKEVVDETSEVNPLTTYSKANRMAEQDCLPLNDENFSVTVLRFSSIFGASPRMRFDLAVNNMVLDLFQTGTIHVSGDGQQWRPFLHILDAAQAYLSVIESSKEITSGEIFNVGADNQNFSIENLANEVKNSIGKQCNIEFTGTHDHRSYVASFKKIKDKLGFAPKYSVVDGASEIYSGLESGKIDYSIKTKTVEWYKHLMSTDFLIKEIELKNTIL